MNAEQWNALFPVGTLVFAYPGCRPEDDRNARRLVTRTRTRAQMSASGDPVVWVDGEGSYICLTHVDPMSESVWQAAKQAEETAAAVAAQGALPVPVATVVPVVPQGRPRTMLDRARDALNARMTKDDLRLVLENVITHAAALNDRVIELEAQRDRRRDRLVALQNDALNMRGSLSPNGEKRKVPFPLGETLTPAVDWLIGRVAELEKQVTAARTDALNEAADWFDQLAATEPDQNYRARVMRGAANDIRRLAAPTTTPEETS